MRLFKARLITERQNENLDLYYPRLLSAYITSSYPWTCPTATIDISANLQSSTSRYIPNIQADDVVRVQVCIRYSTSQSVVWRDVFQGRVMKTSCNWGRDNTTTLTCRGHGEELLYRIVTADYTGSSYTTGTMIASLAGSYLTRLTDAATSLIDSSDSTTITNYNIQDDTKYMVDAIRNFETLEAYGYRFRVQPYYDLSDNLSACYIVWEAIPSTVSETVQIREGTPRVLEASFGSSIESLVDNVTVYGQQTSPQKTGNSSTTSSYNTRYHVETDLSLATDQLCSDLATAIMGRWDAAVVAGYVKILGDPNVIPGDLVYCRLPSIEVDGATIDGNYRVKKVTHDIGQSGYVTYLDLGELDISPYEMIAGFHAKNRLDNANLIT